MALLLFESTNINLKVSKIKNGKIDITMLNYEKDATSVHETIQLNEEELLCLQKWISNELLSFKQEN